MASKVSTCLWFDGQAREAAQFYTSLVPNSRIERAFPPQPADEAFLFEFTLDGTPYQALNGGPQYKHSEAASIVVVTRDQSETDRLWEALTEDGGSGSKCGWLKDRFGVSWQIVPETLVRLFSDPDREAAGRAVQAMLSMTKIDIVALEEAFHGNSPATPEG